MAEISKKSYTNTLFNAFKVMHVTDTPYQHLSVLRATSSGYSGNDYSTTLSVTYSAPSDHVSAFNLMINSNQYWRTGWHIRTYLLRKTLHIDIKNPKNYDVFATSCSASCLYAFLEYS